VLATDQERLLLLVVPLAVAAESWIALKPMSVARRVLARGCVALLSGPLLLLGSVYFTGGVSGWSLSERVFFLLGLGILILVPWLMLATLQQRRPDATISLSLAATSLAAGVTTMLSGYASAGQLGLPLAATLAAAAFVAPAAASPGYPGAVGVGWICLASVLFIGRFFGSLTTQHGVLLGVTPLVCWLAEYWPLCSWGAWPRRLFLLTLTLLLLGTVVWQAQSRFLSRSGSAVPGTATGKPAMGTATSGRALEAGGAPWQGQTRTAIIESSLGMLPSARTRRFEACHAPQAPISEGRSIGPRSGATGISSTARRKPIGGRDPRCSQEC